MPRAYTLAEIDSMRAAVEVIMRPSGAYDPTGLEAKIEDRVRTYMAGGVEPDQLVAKAHEAQEARMRYEEEGRFHHWEAVRHELEPKGYKWHEEWKCIVAPDGAHIYVAV